ncbi:hypothetical protein CPA45_04285 [Vreelandella nigrificans]|uniref:Uncharacterized protein n=1 Tax=Vreelandella nigrificans TaxID=2042704 RepID=A0A2A4HSB4_9GAMM|nr:hypothetical protein CPA45_04285 [Halomonas nigrificans]
MSRNGLTLSLGERGVRLSSLIVLVIEPVAETVVNKTVVKTLVKTLVVIIIEGLFEHSSGL